MQSNQPVITIEYGDWLSEYKKSPIKPRTQQEIIEAMQETSMKPMQAARLAIVGREQGEADAEILPPNKPMFNIGAAHAISQMVVKQTTKVKVNGKTYEARKYVATVEDEPESKTLEATAPANPTRKPTTKASNGKPAKATSSKKTLIESTDPEAAERAKAYVLNIVTGYIWNRLLIIATNKGDVKAVAAQLKASIDEMVGRLT